MPVLAADVTSVAVLLFNPYDHHGVRALTTFLVRTGAAWSAPTGARACPESISNRARAVLDEALHVAVDFAALRDATRFARVPVECAGAGGARTAAEVYLAHWPAEATGKGFSRGRFLAARAAAAAEGKGAAHLAATKMAHVPVARLVAAAAGGAVRDIDGRELQLNADFAHGLANEDVRAHLCGPARRVPPRAARAA